MSERSAIERPSPLRAVSHLYLTADPIYPLVCFGCENMSKYWLAWSVLSSHCSGLSGFTNCVLYVCLSATWINVACLDCGLSVYSPIIFSKPGPLNSLLPGQTCWSHVCCSCVTESWPGQNCLNEASNIFLLVTGLGCVCPLQQKHYCAQLSLELTCSDGFFLG